MRSTFTALWLLGTTSCVNPCGNEVVETVPSPTQKWSAVVFVRDCGATTGFSTQLSILRARENLPNESGNVLVLGDGSGWVTTGATLDKTIRVVWRSDASLELKVPMHSDVRFFSKTHEGVRVEFEEYDKEDR